MCQSQAQGGRRCYGHASSQLQRAESAQEQSFALLGTPEQWGNKTQKQVYARHYKLADRVDKARLAMAGTERGYLELLEKADQIEDGNRGRTNRMSTYASAEWLRCIARAGQAGRGIQEQRDVERERHKAWAATVRGSFTEIVEEEGCRFAVTQRGDRTGSILREPVTEYEARIKRERRERRAAFKAERKARADRLTELRQADKPRSPESLSA